MPKINFIKNKFFLIIPLFLFTNFFQYPLFSSTKKEVVTKNEGLNKSEYILGPGDIVDIKVFSAPELSSTTFILNDGMLQIPLIGSINVNGMTIKNATNKINKLLSKELINPDLLLSVKKTRPLKVSVVGQIMRPGIYSMGINETSQTDKGNNLLLKGLPTVIDAIQKAGGITKEANIKKVTLKRKLPGKENKYKVTNLDLHSLIFKGNQVNNPFLFDGDIIRIEKALNNTEKFIEVSNANLSPKTIKINVIGEVHKPGIIDIPSNSLLSQGIMSAGGPINSRSKISNIELYRVERNGQVTKKKFKYSLKESLSAKNNPSLNNNDTIIVNQNLLSKTSDKLETITKPASGIVTIWSLFKLINN